MVHRSLAPSIEHAGLGPAPLESTMIARTFEDDLACKSALRGTRQAKRRECVAKCPVSSGDSVSLRRAFQQSGQGSSSIRDFPGRIGETSIGAVESATLAVRYLRCVVFDVGLGLTVAGVMGALWVARDIIALELKFYWQRFLGEGGVGAANMNLTTFVLAVLLALIGMGMLLVGFLRVRRGA
jgi:hypothetical protein